ncbi:MAG: sulfite exporter TauE/SafE family protein [Pseudolysinimonas sp.]
MAPDRRAPTRRVLALILVGVIGGLLSGAFGVGGGVVMVPLLLWLTEMDQRHAAATSLVAIVPAAIVGSITYGAGGHVDVVAAILIAVGGVGGSLIGTRLLRTLPLGWLRWLFIALLLVVAVRLFIETPSRGAGFEWTPVTIVGLVVLGLVMGIASGLFGIGGGVLVVPVLVALFGVSDLLAKGVSLLAIIPTATTGTVANARAGLVRVSDGVIVGVAAVLASFGGVAIALLLTPRLSSVLFAILILATVAQLIVRAIRLGSDRSAR